MAVTDTGPYDTKRAVGENLARNTYRCPSRMRTTSFEFWHDLDLGSDHLKHGASRVVLERARWLCR